MSPPCHARTASGTARAATTARSRKSGLERLDPGVAVRLEADSLGAGHCVQWEVVVRVDESREEEVPLERDGEFRGLPGERLGEPAAVDYDLLPSGEIRSTTRTPRSENAHRSAGRPLTGARACRRSGRRSGSLPRRESAGRRGREASSGRLRGSLLPDVPEGGWKKHGRTVPSVSHDARHPRRVADVRRVRTLPAAAA